jgi:hypothetical protein
VLVGRVRGHQVAQLRVCRLEPRMIASAAGHQVGKRILGGRKDGVLVVLGAAAQEEGGLRESPCRASCRGVMQDGACCGSMCEGGAVIVCWLWHDCWGRSELDMRAAPSWLRRCDCCPLVGVPGAFDSDLPHHLLATDAASDLAVSALAVSSMRCCLLFCRPALWRPVSSQQHLPPAACRPLFTTSSICGSGSSSGRCRPAPTPTASATAAATHQQLPPVGCSRQLVRRRGRGHQRTPRHCVSA